ncbi:Protein HTP-1 [Aphelenchoides avenae]|nr:Protein HTP-1 [Aphelenchus avenae]
MASWKLNFPPDVETPDNSTLFMSRMNYIAIASMLFHRGVVPMGHPQETLLQRYVRLYPRVMFHVFNPETKWGKKLHEMMRGIEDGIKAKYVREVQVVFGASQQRPDDILEMMSIKFLYDEDGDAVEITDGAGRPVAKLSYKGMDTFKRQVMELLLQTMAVAGALEKLPEDVVPNMQVLYNKRAPVGYQCKMFRPCDETYAFSEHVEPFNIGRIDSNYGSMFLGVQSKFVHSMAVLAQTVHDRSVELVREAQAQRKLNHTRSELDTSIGEMDASFNQSAFFHAPDSTRKHKNPAEPLRHSPEPGSSPNNTMSDDAPPQATVSEPKKEAVPKSGARKRKGKETPETATPKKVARATRKKGLKPLKEPLTESSVNDTKNTSVVVQPMLPKMRQRRGAQRALFTASEACRRGLLMSPSEAFEDSP